MSTQLPPPSRLLKQQVKPTMMRSAISKLKSQGLQPQDVKVDQRSGRVGKAINQKRVVEIYKLYQKRLVQSNALDFDDIILVALRLLQQDSGGVFIIFLFPWCCTGLLFPASVGLGWFWVSWIFFLEDVLHARVEQLWDMSYSLKASDKVFRTSLLG